MFRAGDPAHSLYAVRQGLLKTVHVNADGDEQILALNTPGEVLGLEAFSAGTYANDVIALQAVVCCELPCVSGTSKARASGNSVPPSSGS